MMYIEREKKGMLVCVPNMVKLFFFPSSFFLDVKLVVFLSRPVFFTFDNSATFYFNIFAKFF